jgi:hypothetical protein
MKDENPAKNSDPARRLVAKIRLKNKDGKFWSKDLPQMSEAALLPEDDLC